MPRFVIALLLARYSRPAPRRHDRLGRGRPARRRGGHRRRPRAGRPLLAFVLPARVRPHLQPLHGRSSRPSSFDTFPPDRFDDTLLRQEGPGPRHDPQNDRKPEIVIDRSRRPEGHHVGAHARGARGRPGATPQVQLEMLERLGEVLERLESLTERMARSRIGWTSSRAARAAHGDDAAQQQATWSRRPDQPHDRRPSRELRRAAAAARIRSAPHHQARHDAQRQVERLVGKPDSVEYGSGGGRPGTTASDAASASTRAGAPRRSPASRSRRRQRRSRIRSTSAGRTSPSGRCRL